ncbi:MAG: ATP phosphoribosyltransferase [Dehalococcoidales bacterium]|nr:ATP phosphoribosyltransferase [Dehalococcoidales bacterium]
MSLKIALPKGRLMAETAALLNRAGWGLAEYREKSRLYRLRSETMPRLSAKVFHERDIPIQVAIGNYDLGICGLDWVEELLAKYPSSAVEKVRDLGYGAGALHLVASKANGATASLDEVSSLAGGLRIASEYPNLAESLALDLRLRRFSVFPLWGGAEVYPPESADLALVPGRVGQSLFDYELASLGEVQRYAAFLIVNKDRRQGKDIRELVSSLEAALAPGGSFLAAPEAAEPVALDIRPGDGDGDTVRLALPDGHQQQPTLDLLHRAGIEISDYPSPRGNRRPLIKLDGVTAKVIRPQDMPLQVANGNFDLAVTGRDWLREHLYQFPSSPAVELVDLGFGRVRIVAVVTQDTVVSDVYGLRQLIAERPKSLRVASEYVNIADKYARDNHLGGYRVVPTWGATEAFLPEDADLLIENTQTGRTIAKHNLKIIDTLGESSACLIGSRRGKAGPAKRARMDSLINSLRLAVEDA